MAGLIDLLLITAAVAGAAMLVAVRFPGVRSADGTVVFTTEQQQRLQALDGPLSRGHLLGDTLWAFSSRSMLILCGVLAAAALLIGVIVPLLTSGRSPGKFATGLKVTNVHGEPAGVVAHLIRTVAAAADLMPLVVPGLTGFAFAASTPRNQRIGDRLAGTVVGGTTDSVPDLESVESRLAPAPTPAHPAERHRDRLAAEVDLTETAEESEVVEDVEATPALSPTVEERLAALSGKRALAPKLPPIAYGHPAHPSAEGIEVDLDMADLDMADLDMADLDTADPNRTDLVTADLDTADLDTTGLDMADDLDDETFADERVPEPVLVGSTDRLLGLVPGDAIDAIDGGRGSAGPIVTASLNNGGEHPDQSPTRIATPGPLTHSSVVNQDEGWDRPIRRQHHGDPAEMSDSVNVPDQPDDTGRSEAATDRVPVEERSRNPYPKPMRPSREPEPEPEYSSDYRALTLPESSLSDMPLTNTDLFAALGLTPEEVSGFEGAHHAAATGVREGRHASVPAPDNRAPIWSDDWDAWIYWDTTLRGWFRHDADSGNWVPMEDDDD